MMTNKEIFEIALKQSAIDCNCSPDDFLKSENVMTISKANHKARKYLPLPFECGMVSYGSNIVAQTSERLADVTKSYIDKYPVTHCFEAPHINVLNDLLLPYGFKVCFMAEYFLPDVTKLRRLDCPYEMRILHKADFENLYKPEWSNALCEKRKELDILGCGAYHKDKLIGFAGCSADCDDMYQIGIDVLPEYRRLGIASALTSNLACEILSLGKVPFYCAAWCNIPSVRNAVKSGFSPAWVELTARDTDFVDQMNSSD